MSDEIYTILARPKERQERIREQALAGIRDIFPMQLDKHTLDVEDVHLQEREFGPAQQKKTILGGGSLYETIKGKLVLRDPLGKVVDRSTTNLLHLPYLTPRGTFVVRGTEYEIPNQLRFRPGVYTRHRVNGDLEAWFNRKRGANFRVAMDPSTGHFGMELGSTRIPLYPVLRGLGIPDKEIQNQWGSDVLGQNKEWAGTPKKTDSAMASLYRKVTPRFAQTATSTEAKRTAIREHLALDSLDPEVMRTTLGIPTRTADPATILQASGKLLRVFKGEAEPDERTSTPFLSVHSADDFIRERLVLDARALRRKLALKLRMKGAALEKIVPPGLFTRGIRGFITTSAMSANPTQINPMEMIDHSSKVTFLGEGGIADERAVPPETRRVHWSQMGIIDPIRTPETFNIGVDVRSTIRGGRDRAGRLYARMLDPSGRQVWLPASNMPGKNLAFPNQELKGKVDVLNTGEIRRVDASQVDFQVPSGSHLHGAAANLVPFVESSQGNRLMMGAKMATQAVPLLHREAPLIQVGTRIKGWSHEDEVGKNMVAPFTPVAGTIAKIDDDYIYIRPDKRTKRADDDMEKRAWGVVKYRQFKGMRIAIENPKGETRSGVDPDGTEWSCKMKDDYGYLPSTATSADKEGVDVFLGEDRDSDHVYVIHQLDEKGDFDELKVMIGYPNERTAKAHYMHNYDDTWGDHRIKKIDSLSVDDFKERFIPAFKKAAADARELVRVPYDHYFPLSSKTYLHDTLSVKTGDKVKKGQRLGESNFTRNGTLALGRNLDVGYMPYRGLNSNDAVVVSESAAKNLTSQHMYTKKFEPSMDSLPGRQIHQTYFGNRYTKDQYKHLDKKGIARPGSILNHGDPIIVSVRKTKPTAESQILGRFHKSLVKPYAEEALTWDHTEPGEIVDVVHQPNGRTAVTVKMQAPIQVGDKLCYAPDHDVLTERGWIPVGKLNHDDKICTCNAEGEIEYHVPARLFSWRHDGELYHIAAQQLDLLVTLDHQMYVQKRGHTQFELLPAEEIEGKRVRYCKTGVWGGEYRNTFSVPGEPVPDAAGKVTHDFSQVPMDLWLEFLGYFLSEGSATITTNDHLVVLHQTPQGRNSFGGAVRAKMQACLDALGWNYTARPDRFIIHSKQLYTYLARLGKAHEKYVPREFLFLVPRQMRILFNALMSGDGSCSVSGSLSYYTSSPQLADDVQEIALKIGWAANVIPVPIENQKDTWHDRYRVAIVRKKLYPQVNHGHVHHQHAQTEERVHYKGRVFCCEVPNHVLYVRRNGKPCWSGNSNRYGGKGVVSAIIPDAKMIQTGEGKALDLLWSSPVVISRINPAQIIETAAAKVARKTGKPIRVAPYSGRDNVKWATGLLKEHGLKDKEDVLDPVTGKTIKNVMVGPQYIYKLFKSTDTNFSTAGAGDYDLNQQPSSHGETGAKRLGRMELNALLAHNARNLLREAMTVKSDRQDEFWRAMQLGQPLPSPKASFAYNKFLTMLQGAGIRVDKKKDVLSFGPLTDNDIKALNTRPVQNSLMVRAKDLRPERGGLFDPGITGGPQGERWSHIDLEEPIVNPIFIEPVRRLLGETEKGFLDRLSQVGGGSIKKELNSIDVTSRLKSLGQRIPKASASARDDLIKQRKYLEALRQRGLLPGDAYTMSRVPVIPPTARPFVPAKGSKDLLIADVNYLYRDTMLANDALKDAKKFLPPDEVAKARGHLQDSVGAVFGLNEPVSPQQQGRNARGLLGVLVTGTKNSYFQAKLMRRPQALSSRGTAAPDMSLEMDEFGMPEQMAWANYGPFVMRRLVQSGYPAMDAQKMIEDKVPAAFNVLSEEIRKRPTLINRAPTLHRHGIVAAYPRIIPGKTIRVNPFIEEGLNLDYDGDSVDCDLDTFQDGCYTRLHISEMPRLEESVVKKGNTEIFEVPSGIQVFSYNDETGRVELVEVEGFSIHHNLEMVDVAYASKRSVRLSRDHSAYAVNPETWELERCRAEDAIGWASPRPRTLFSTHVAENIKRTHLHVGKNKLLDLSFDFALDEEAGWFFGAFAGDGWVSYDVASRMGEHYAKQVGITNESSAVLDAYLAWALKFDPSITHSDHEVAADANGSYGLSHKRHINNHRFAQIIGEIMDHCRGSENKHLPRCFVNAPREFLLGLAGGLLDTDGSVSLVQAKAKTKPQWMSNYTTTSPRLRDEVCTLFTLLGIKTGCSPNKLRKGRKQAWTITISTPDLVRIAHEIQLRTPEKAARLERLSKEVDADGPESARWDMLPIDPALADLIGKMIGSPKKGDTPEKRKQKTLYAQFKKAGMRGKGKGRISRRALAHVTEILGAESLRELGGEAWWSLVTNENIFFDFIEEVTPLPGKHTAWDLTVPGSNTFMTSNQILVFDTLQLHVPVTPTAVTEAQRMTLPNMLFSDKQRDSLLVFPQQEAILGTWMASKPPRKGARTKTFKTQADATNAYYRGDLKLDDAVKIGGK